MPTTSLTDEVSAPSVQHAGSRDRIRHLGASLLVGICCFLVYNSNGRAIASGDTYPSRYLPFALLQHGTLFLDPVAGLAAADQGDRAYWIQRLPDGRAISLYPIVQPVLLAPLYAPAALALLFRGSSEPAVDYAARVMEKLAASLVASLSAVLMYLLLRRRTTAAIAAVLTVAYAFGTATWVISSQALWQHGMAQLLIIAALFLVTARCTPPRVAAVGVICTLIATNRPPDAVLAAALGFYALCWAGRERAWLLVVSAAIPACLTLLYNLGVAGHVAGAYGRVGDARFFGHDLMSGIAGLLLSPTRGLLVFSPFFVFLILAWRHLPTDRDERLLTALLAIAVVVQILLYAKTDWRSGISWGPRFMTDLVPLLIWMLVPVVASLRRTGRVLFMLAVSVSIAFEAVGAFCYTGETDQALFANGGDAGKRAAWNWRNSPILSFRNGVAPAELRTRTRGSIDAVLDAGRPVTTVAAGAPVVATGWALAGSSTPWKVAIVLDGQPAVSTRTFHDRADVRTATGTASATGWRIALDTSRLTPGTHSLTAFAWSSPLGEPHLVGARKLNVSAPTPRAAAIDTEDLDTLFRTAAARIREGQQSEGSWLTQHTTSTRFEDAQPEMNTYLTALMIDLLLPIADGSGLQGSVQRARAHLTEQIEPTGLVRYHGRPDAPGIGTLGCVITPDVDDTALAWRLAPRRDRTLLANALSTIEHYRTPEGLYRTWLAPREAYQCLDPGTDPNPADFTIQAHLLLLLAEEDPAKGRKLCAALRDVVDADRVWVYYRKAPLVPTLRLADLQGAGCAIALPESRMRTDVAGQQIWLAVARELARPRSSRRAADTIKPLLLELARNDFALLRSNPPLLYHNDLSATVSRYYWSIDAGYALWMMLYQER